MVAPATRLRARTSAAPTRPTGQPRTQGARRAVGIASALILGGTFVALVLLEQRRPLRGGQREPRTRRAVRNLAVAAASATAIELTDRPVTGPLTQWVERRRWGLVKLLGLPRPLEIVAAMLLLDYTLYLWHVAFHKVPWLWRVHQPHHVDLDMDAFTAIRFHFGEMILSVGLKSAQVLLIGVGPRTMSIWNTWLLAQVMFHHSNVRLPYWLERRLCRLIVTPRMHGIHHSIVPKETDSNWSSGLTLWDYLHGTLKLNVPQDEITLGVPAYQQPRQVTLPRVLAMPFRRRLPDPWTLAGDGRPQRAALPGPPTHLRA